MTARATETDDGARGEATAATTADSLAPARGRDALRGTVDGMTMPDVPALPAGDAAFDVLSDYFLAAVQAAGTNDTLLRVAIARSIRGFYDAMEANGQERGERSGDFYWVDGVAIADSDREVPILRVRMALGPEIAERIVALWDDVQLTIR